MMSTTAAQSSTAMESPLNTGELAISLSRDGEVADAFSVEAVAAEPGELATTRASDFDSLGAMKGTVGEPAAVAGRILTGIGTQAISAGTSRSVESVTSQTRWRAPADARCIDNVIPSATSKISVAFA